MLPRLRLSLLAALSLTGACATDEADKAPAHWTSGKADGAFEMYEAGAAKIGAAIEVDLKGRLPAYRVESYGGTKLTIDVAGVNSEDGYLLVEGPLARNDGDGVAIASNPMVAEDDDSGDGRNATATVTLDKPGVYRIIAGTYESLSTLEVPEGTLSVRVDCSANCTRPAIDQKTFVAQLQQQGGGAFGAVLKDKIAEMVPDPVIAAALGAQLDAILADPQHAGLERFPTLKLADIGTLRPALGAFPSDPPEPQKVVHGELRDLLGPCNLPREVPGPIDARLPGVGYGHFPNRVMSPCEFSHAKSLAQVLTSLAADNGSEVTIGGTVATTPKDVFDALLRSGHTIRVRNERMYANFLSATVGDNADLRWPVWLDTGIRLSNGETLTIPMGHSHHAWEIHGPLVNTNVMFYLGIDGAGFFGQSSQRPAWTGMVAATDELVSGADADYALDTVTQTTLYMQQVKRESTGVAAGMPADGYGFVGVCNDSNAFIELTTKGTISAFPLLRAKSLDSAPSDPADTSDVAGSLAQLPHDGDGISDESDALRRAMAMQPAGEPVWDTKLADQLRTARADAQ